MRKRRACYLYASFYGYGIDTAHFIKESLLTYTPSFVITSPNHESPSTIECLGVRFSFLEAARSCWGHLRRWDQNKEEQGENINKNRSISYQKKKAQGV